jgi:tyrosyl-tRNA synthetase
MTTASGAKMGKSAAGAIWLDIEKTSAFDFYQYWVNTDDLDVVRFLSLYTFLPMGEIAAVKSLEGKDLNVCKSILAFEVTALVHGKEHALAAYEAASNVFGHREIAAELLPSSSIPRTAGESSDAIPTTDVDAVRLEEGIPAYEIFVEVGLCVSRGAARRLIQQGGAYVNEVRIKDIDMPIGLEYLTGQELLLKAGKKKVHRIRVR